jgi:DNA-binding MarR family transcriptional regulator
MKTPVTHASDDPSNAFGSLDDQRLKLEHQLCFALYTASRKVTRAYKPLLDELGLTYPQYLVMLVLWEWNLAEQGASTVGPSESNTVTALGQRLHLDSGTLTPLLKRLESAGLVERVRSATDERRVCLGLTRKGQALKEHAYPIPEALLCKFDSSVEDLTNLRAQIEALLLS